MNRLILLILFSIPLFSRAEILEGVAKNRMGEVVYIEKHSVQLDEYGLNKFIRVEYLKPDGSPFATMTSDFSASKTVPETIFEDTRFKSKSVLRLTGKNIEFEELKNDKPIAKKTIPYSDTMVASQGFDNFIKINFSKLQSEPIEFKFGVLESKDFFSLTGYKKTKNSAEIEYGIKGSSWLLRLFSSELKVKYDTTTKQLKSFAGRSNILDDAGRSQDVVIDYKWKNSL